MGFKPVLEMNLGRYSPPLSSPEHEFFSYSSFHQSPYLHHLPVGLPLSPFSACCFIRYNNCQISAFCVLSRGEWLNIHQSSISSFMFHTHTHKINTALTCSLLALANANIWPCGAARTSQHWLSLFTHSPHTLQDRRE